MAYYSSGFYGGDYAGEYYQTGPLYCSNYDVVPFQGSQSYSGYDLGEPQYLEYSSNPYYGGAFAYDPFPGRSEIHYSTYSVMEPNLIEYNPISHETQYVISYNSVASEVDDTEFEEYDPTPYDGGYNQSLTYGEPLPPSDEICYPRSQSIAPSRDNLSLKDHLAEDSESKPSNGSKPSKPIEEEKEEEKKTNGGGEEKRTSDSSQEEQSGVDSTSDDHVHDHGHLPWSGYDYWNRGVWNGGYGYNGHGWHIPYGYGLEAMDLCGSLFGYFPCLCKYRKKCEHQQGGIEESQERGWKSSEEYFFGGPNITHGGGVGAPYYGEPTHSYYERHYTQVEGGGEDSWVQNFRMF